MKGAVMPNLPAPWRKYLYGLSAATIPVLVIVGWVSDELGVALLGLANAVFIGGLAFANTNAKDPDQDDAHWYPGGWGVTRRSTSQGRPEVSPPVVARSWR